VLRATLKSLFARKVRLVLTTLSIVLGVGFVAGTFVLTDTMNTAFNQLFKQAGAGIDVVVRSQSAFTAQQQGGGGAADQREPIPDSVLSLVESVDGVKAASGVVTGTAQMIDPATKKAIGTFAPTFGGNWTDTNGALVLRQGAPPNGPQQVVVDAGTASKYHLRLAEAISIVGPNDVRSFTISGITGFGSADNLGGATLALFDLKTAQDFLGKPGVFDEIDVVAADGVDPSALRANVAAVLPKGVEAVTSATVSDEQSKALQDGLGFFRTALLAFAFIALFVGAFIIFNTFSIIVAQRTKEVALLRAIGASRRQVMVSVVGEAFVTGLLASVLGIVAGIGIALGLQGLLKAFGIDLPSTAMQLRARTIVVSLIVGTVVTVASCILPARRAARVAPVQALRDSADAMGGGSLGRRLIVGLIVTGLGAAALLYGLFGKPSNAASLVGLGAAVTFIGVAMLSPLAARPLAGIIGWPVRGLGIQGRLGRENAMRNPRRTASTASALMVGLGLVAMVAILSSSLKASFTAALNGTLKADFTLTTSQLTSFSPDVATKAAAVPGVATATEFRQGGFRVNGSDSAVTGTDPSTVEAVTDLGVTAGSLSSLSQGEIMVFKDTAQANGWKVGDTIQTAFASLPAPGNAPLTVGGIFDHNEIVGDYLISLDTYEKYFTEQRDTFVMVKLAPGANPATVQAALESATASFGNIEVQDQTAFREKQAGFIDKLLGLVTALLAMAILIALFGIVNTLGLSVLERKHELGLLRAVGMSRKQVKRMIRWESVIIAILGAVLGIAIGFLFGFALQQSLVSQGVTQLAIPGGQLIFYVIFAGLAGVIAAIWPARRAARLNVLEAISYE
jgi:putative ABC transport system permease protein